MNQTQYSTLQNREGNALVTVSLDAGHNIIPINQAIESCYRSDGFDKLLWNTRYVDMLNKLEGVSAFAFNLNTGEVMK